MEEVLKRDIDSLKLLLSILEDSQSQTRVVEDEIQNLSVFNDIKKVEVLREELKKIEDRYNNFPSKKIRAYDDETAGIIESIVYLRLEILTHIRSNELPDLYNTTLRQIVEYSKKMLEYNGNLADEDKEKKLNNIKKQYETVLKDIKGSKIDIDRKIQSEVEEAVAKLIIDVIKKRKTIINQEEVKELIELRYAEKVLTEILNQLKNIMEQGEEKQKKGAEALYQELRKSLLEIGKDPNKQMGEVLYDSKIDLINRFVKISKQNEQIKDKETSYEETTTQEQEEQELTKEEIEIQKLREYKDYIEYRKSRIEEWQKVTGKSSSIAPGPGEVTIITIKNDVKKMPYEKFKKYRKSNYAEIKVLIFGENIEEIEVAYEELSTDEEIMWHKYKDGMGNLQDVIFNADLKTIGRQFFAGSHNIQGELKLPPELETIERAAFMDCSSIHSVVFPTSMKFFSPGPFACNTHGIGMDDNAYAHLERIFLPRNIKIDDISREIIGEMSARLIFKGSPEETREIEQVQKFREYRKKRIEELETELQSKESLEPGREEMSIITSNNRVKKISYEKFLKGNLGYLKRGEGIRSIILGQGISVIEGCQNPIVQTTNEIIFNEDLQTISSAAFQSYRQLQQLYLPPQLFSIEWKAFEECDMLKLKNIIFPSTIHKIDNNAFDFSKINTRDIVIPSKKCIDYVYSIFIPDTKSKKTPAKKEEEKIPVTKQEIAKTVAEQILKGQTEPEESEEKRTDENNQNRTTEE